jgi:hypothetical protein
MRFTVTDDSGFLAIVDPDSYRGFVGDDWTYGSLFDHFTHEMQRRSLLVWATDDSAPGPHFAISLSPAATAGEAWTHPRVVRADGRVTAV